MEAVKLAAIWQRVYGDFLMPSKLNAYKSFLEEFLNHNYRICSIASLWDQIKNSSIKPQDKYLVLRHDIDTDSSTARAMWEIEQMFSVKSSFYFRLSTLDITLMKQIEISGGEASYHFEELATVIKQKHLKTRDEALQQMPYIREVFRSNLNRLRSLTGLAMRIVAAHGDFVNRKLQLYNWEILKCPSFRRDVGVELEVYDEAFMRHISSRHSEVLPPFIWEPADPLIAAYKGAQVIQILVHPRQWRANIRENLIDDVKRAWEGVRHAL